MGLRHLTPLSLFQSWVPRGRCQLADTGVTLLAPAARDWTAFGESSMPRLLLYQSFTRASAERMHMARYLHSREWRSSSYRLFSGPNCFHF
jgi:hypothetical protein